MLWKRKLLISALMGAGLTGTLAFDARQASRSGLEGQVLSFASPMSSD
jgi:hypothetical protein